MVAAASPTIVFRNSQRIVSLMTHLQTREFQDAKYVFGVWKMCPENASSEVRRKLLQLTEGFLEKTMGQGASRGWFAAASEAVNVLFALAQRFDVVAERLLWRVAREVFVDDGDDDGDGGDDDDDGDGGGSHSNTTTENNNSNGNDVSDHANNTPHDHSDITHDQENITSDHRNITNDHRNNSNDHNNNSNDHNNNSNDPNITNNQSNTTHHPTTNTPSETAAESPSLPLNPTEASLARFLFLLGQVALKLLQFTEQVATQAKRLRHRREEEERQKKAVANSMGLVTVSDDIEEEEMERISASEIVVK